MIRNYFEKPIRKRFIDAFPKFERDDDEDESISYFWETWTDSPFYLSALTKDDLKEIYHHLMAAYYDWHFIYPDDLGIKYNVMHVIEEYYPNVKERLSLVAQIRGLTLDAFKKSGINIQSSAQNPRIATDMDELVDLVDSQVADFQLKSDEQALRAKFMSLYDGIIDEFIERFRYMFVRLYNGVNSYLYINKINEEEGDEVDG